MPLLWDEYVEDVAEGLRSRRRARELRREVRDHLLCLKEQFLDEGLAADDAERKAMEVFGPAEILVRRFRDLERPHRPLWPVAVTLVVLLWAIGCLGTPAAPDGYGVLLLLWSIAWGLLHLRSFATLLYRLQARQPVSSGIAWSELLPRAWVYAGAGALGGLAFALLYSSGAAGLGLFGVLLSAAISVAALLAAERLPWFRGGEAPPLRHPLTAGVATTGLLVALLIAFNLFPRLDPIFYDYGSFAPSVPSAWPAFATSLPAAGCIAALYFTGCAALEWLRARVFEAAPPAPDSTLTIE